MVEDMKGLTIGAEYNVQATLPCIQAMVTACVKPTAINNPIFLYPSTTNKGKTTQIQS
jgi:hypothetical protein